MQNEYKLLKTIAKIKLKRYSGEEVWTTIDIDDFDKVMNTGISWHVKYVDDIDAYYTMANYRKDCGAKSTIYLHQLIVGSEAGDTVDHINHDTLNNRKTNLRIVSKSKNAKNRKGANKNNTFGYRNVSYIKREGKYIVQLQINGKNTRFGKFDDADEAGKHAEEMRRVHYGKFAGKG